MNKFISKKIKKVLSSILLVLLLLLNSGALSIAYSLAENEVVSAEAILEAQISKYNNYDIHGKKGVLIQMDLKSGIRYEKKEQYAPIKQSVIILHAPKLEEKNPERVEVIAKSTKATNGKTNDISADYSYDETSGILKITTVNSQNEKGEYYKDYSEDARDEYEVIYHYGEECYSENLEERTLDVEAKFEPTIYGENVNIDAKEYKDKQIVKENIGDVISSEVITEQIFDGYIRANNQNGTNYGTEYKEVTEFMISLKDMSDKIILEEENQILNNKDKQINESKDLIYKETRIDKNQMLELLGQDGKIEISKEDGTVLKEITKDTEVTEQDFVLVKYTEDINKIVIKMSKPQKEGYLTVRNIKAIKGSMTDINAEKIKVNHNVKAVNYSEEENVLEQVVSKTGKEIKINTAESKIDVTIDKTELTNSMQNKVTLMAILNTNGSRYSLFKNPVVEIELPNEIEKVVLGKVSTLYDEELQIVNSTVYDNSNGNKVIRIELKGTQTQYLLNSTQVGNNIIIPAVLIAKKDIETVNTKIKATYTNEIQAPTTYSLLGNSTQDIDIKINSIFNDEQKAIIVDENENKETSNIQELIEQNALEVEIVAQVGNENVKNDGTIYEGEVIKYAMTVKNTTNSAINNISVKGQVPENTVYATVDIGTYWKEAYKYVEDETIKDYTFAINSLQPGESKTEFYEVVVKDLQEGLTEKAISNEFIVTVGEEEYSKKTLANIVKEAEIDIDVISYIGRGQKNTFVYFIKVKNNTSEVLNNIQLETSKIQKEITVNSAVISPLEDAEGNIGGNNGEQEPTTPPADDTEGDTGEPPKLENFGKIEDGKLKGTIESIEPGKNFIIQMNVTAENFDDNVNECPLILSATATTNENTIYRSNENRRNAYPEYVTAQIDLEQEGEKVDIGEEIEYKITIKNHSKIKTFVKVEDYLPEYLEGVSLEYDKYFLSEEDFEEPEISEDEDEENDDSSVGDVIVEDVPVDKMETEYDIEAEANLECVIKHIKVELDANDLETADIEEDLMIPAGKTVELKLKVRTEYVPEDTEISNHVVVSGNNIKNVTSNVVKFTLATEVIPEIPEEPEEPDVPDEPDKPDEPDIPVDPEDPDQPGEPEEPTEEKHDISGLVWIDQNKDGKRQNAEQVLSGITVKLYDFDTNSLVYDDDGSAKITRTDFNGQYSFKDIITGNYMVLFEYDTQKYSITTYQNNDVEDNLNSDAISKEVSIDNDVKMVGLTDVIKLENANVNNIDMGLVENPIFDLKLDKYVSGVNVSNSQGTREYQYNNEKLTKVEIHSKLIKETLVTIEYTMVVTNEGDIEAYAEEIIDYIPNGLTFNASYNQNWSKKSDGQLVYTGLSNELIAPGASKEIKLVLIKQMQEDSTGTVVNAAEIGKSSNFNGLPELDSVVNNQVKTEDDYSEAEVIISVETGIVQYTIITILIIGILIFVALCIMGKIKLPKNIKHISSMFMIAIMTLMVLCSNAKALTITYGDGTHFYGSDGNTYYCGGPGMHQCAVGIHYYTFNYSTITKREKISESTKTVTLSTNSESEISSKKSGNYSIVGPYKVKSNLKNSTISSISIKYTIDGTSKTGSNIVDSSGNRIDNRTMEKGKYFTFYIKVPARTTAINSVKIKVKVKNTKVVKERVSKTLYYYCSGVGSYHENGSSQPTSATPGGTQPMYRYTTETETTKEDTTKSVSFSRIDLTGSLAIEKKGLNGKAMAGVQFRVTGPNNYSTTVKTNSSGKAQIDDLKIGTYTVTEVGIDNTGYGQANYGYVVKPLSKNVTVESSIVKTASFQNEYELGSIYIVKKDTLTKKGLPNVEFTLQMLSGEKSGQYVGVNSAGDATYSSSPQIIKTNARGEITINKMWTGQYKLIETRNPNPKYEALPSGGKVIVSNGTIPKKGERVTVEAFNKYVYGKIKIIKLIEGTTLPLQGVEFTLYKADKTTVVGKYVTGPDGTFTTGSIPMGEYWIAETKVPSKFMKLEEGRKIVLVEDERFETHTETIYNRQIRVDLSGYVWVDENSGKTSVRNGLFKQNSDDNKDILLDGVPVRLMRNGRVIASSSTRRLGRYTSSGNGEYLFENVEMYENGKKILNEYYIEFDYDGITYTNVAVSINSNNGSKAIENSQVRASFDSKFNVIDGSNVNPSTDKGLVSIGSNGQKYNLSYTRDRSKYKSTINYTDVMKITANTRDAGYNMQNFHSPGILEIKYINLGIQRREQPNLALVKDLDNVRLSVNGYTHIYEYNQKAKKQSGSNGFNNGFNVGVKFESRYNESYRRAVYAADINYIETDPSKKSNELKVNMVYKIELANSSSTLTSTVQKIVDYYDSRYTLVKAGTNLSNGLITNSIPYSKVGGYNSNGYSKAVVDTNMQISPQKVETIYLEFELNRQAVLQIMNGNKTLNNVAEILTYSTYKGGAIYAGIDVNSMPGNAIPGDKTTYEDDTDKAPSLILEVADARNVKGTVFEDVTTNETKTGSTRQGDGVYNPSKDVLIGGVDVEMKSVRTANANKTYKTKTVNENGWYTFTTQENGNVITITPTKASQGTQGAVQLNKGEYYINNYIPDEYVITFVWGDDTYTVQQYKGVVYEQSRYNKNQTNKLWYKSDINTRYTDAIDDYTLRENIDAQTNTRPNVALGRISKMNSSTPVMLLNVEYDTNTTASEGDRYEYTINNIDMGIVERARQLINLDKKVDSLKIMLANGNVIVDVKVNHATGQLEGQTNGSTIYLAPTPDGHNGMLKAELDSELIQGSRAIVNYIIEVENLSEVDYNDKNYYLHGKVPQNGANIVKLKPEGVYDYLERTLTETETPGNDKWQIKTFEEHNREIGEITETEFRDKVSEYYSSTQNNPDGGTTTTTYSMMSENKYYASEQEIIETWKQEIIQKRKKNFEDKIILFNEELTKELGPGQTNQVSLETAKELSNGNEIALDNQAEITKITKNGGAIPNVIKNKYTGELFDEAETVTVTPATGENRNYLPIITLGISTLMILGAGVVLIKKKVLNK